MLRYTLDVLQGKEVNYPFSREAIRNVYVDHIAIPIAYTIVRDCIIRLERFFDTFERIRAASDSSFVNADKPNRATVKAMRMLITNAVA
jgi:hypothetical protein